MTATYTLNAELNGIEIQFDGKPEASIFESLKAIGYRWHKAKKLWYAKQNPDTLSLAQSLAADTTESVKTSDGPSLAEKIHKAHVSVWGNDAHMIEWLDKNIIASVELENGMILTESKRKIETEFCFGYSSCGQGPEYAEAAREERKASESETYFLNENLRIYTDELSKIGDPEWWPVLRPTYADKDPDNTLWTLEWYRLYDLINYYGYEAEQPGYRTTLEDNYRREIYIPTKDDLGRIRGMIEEAKAKHEKRCNAYLKRYGLSKIRTWTYWLDD